VEAYGGRPLVLGHRGARREAPENTLPAFRRALELGADGVELDARLAADGTVIVLHDDSLERTTNGQGRADRLSWDELRCLDAGGRYGPAFAGTPLCTLAEALQVLAPARLVNVELKGLGRDSGLERQVLEVVRQAGMVQRVVLSSFSRAHLGRLRRLDERIALAWLFQWRWQWPIAFWLARSLQLQALHPAGAVVTERALCRAHRLSLRVVPWTVNQEEVVRRMLSWGVDGLITDRPGEVRGWALAFSGERSAISVQRSATSSERVDR
jgi:glycerophosphoryl diester phosphodiesterase